MGKAVWIAMTLTLSGAFAAPKYEAVFQGVDSKSGKPCLLQVSKTYYAGKTSDWADLRAEVTTSYGHGSETPGEVVLKPHATSDQHLEGTNPDAILKVSLETAKKFSSVKTYTLKWSHGSHAHVFQCADMKVK